MGQAWSSGTGAALAEESLRAEIGVRLNVATGGCDVHGGRDAHRSILEGAFNASDFDGDGCVDFAEFRATAAAIGLGVSESELRSAFRRFDADGDGMIVFAE